MAYNSDGYIMVDFSDVDFREANQYVEGMFNRLRCVIGTNKFVLVINANGKTPLPSTVSITNGQYVIESCIYTFSVNSSDMLHITRHDPTGLIDDTVITNNKTWSSYKINAEIEAAAGGGVVLTETLEAGNTSVDFTDERITSATLIEVFTDTFNAWITNEVVVDDTLTVSFLAMDSNVVVKVRLS